MEPKFDCRFYLGEKPCTFKRLCEGCEHYAPMGVRIVIIKLGAIGDALRTTPLLQGLKRVFPRRHVTWITDAQSYPVLDQNPLIDQLLTIDSGKTEILLPQEFDYLFCLDKDPAAIALAMRLSAVNRRGFAMTPYGTLDTFNDAANYSLILGLDDHLKFNINRKTYQEMLFEIAEIDYEKDGYVYHLDDEDRLWAGRFREDLNATGRGPRIGLNTGCGRVFATKRWPAHHFASLAELLRSQLDARVYLLGGEAEVAGNRLLESRLSPDVVNTGSHPLTRFAGILSHMDCVVTGDTLAMHLALAVERTTGALFGPTCHREIEFYGRGIAIVSSSDCLNCYKAVCKREAVCMNMIEPETVFRAVSEMVRE